VEGLGLHVDAATNDVLLALLPVDLLLQVLEVGDVTWIGKNGISLTGPSSFLVNLFKLLVFS
jgi:hypothetical protein